MWRSCSIARPNSTVDRMRAQFRPWPFARATHSHRTTTTRLKTIHTVMIERPHLGRGNAVAEESAHLRRP